MFLRPLHQMKYPRFNALLRDIKFWILANPTIKKELLDWTSSTEAQLNSVLTFAGGSPPFIIVEVIPPGSEEIKLTIDEVNEEIKKNPGKKLIKKKEVKHNLVWASRISGKFDQPYNISIEQFIVLRFEKEHVVYQVDKMAFRLLWTLLHELGHYLRFHNNVGLYWKSFSNKDLELEEKYVYRLTERALELKEKTYTPEWEEKFWNYAPKHIPYFIHLHKRLYEERQNPDENFYPDDLKLYLRQELW